MSALAVQKLLVAGMALGLATCVVGLVRSGRLAVRYGLGWLAVALAMLVAAPLLGLVETLADALGLTPTGLLIGVVVGFLVLVCLQLSVSLSGSQNQIRALSESNALLDAQLRALSSSGGVSASTNRTRSPDRFS
jgi:Uncharacterized conserved protein (DUF2304)